MTIGIATPGFSSTARYIDDATAESRRDLQSRFCFGSRERLFEELCSVWNDCRKANWDGYQALPVEVDTYQNAYRFLEALPLGCPSPSIGVEPDGALTLEWYQSARRLLSVSVNPTCEVDYAGLFGSGGRVCGTEDFFGDVPDLILNLIQRVYES